MGCASALVFANLGAAYGTAKGGVGLCSMGVMSPGLVMKNIIGVVMAGVLGIYGLIVAVIISGQGESCPLLSCLAFLPDAPAANHFLLALAGVSGLSAGVLCFPLVLLVGVEVRRVFGGGGKDQRVGGGKVGDRTNSAPSPRLLAPSLSFLSVEVISLSLSLSVPGSRFHTCESTRTSSVFLYPLTKHFSLVPFHQQTANAIPNETDLNVAMNKVAKCSPGLCCGLAGLGAGFAIGITADAGVRAGGQQGLMYVGVILILIFGEALGLYGLIVALVLAA